MNVSTPIGIACVPQLALERLVIGRILIGMRLNLLVNIRIGHGRRRAAMERTSVVINPSRVIGPYMKGDNENGGKDRHPQEETFVEKRIPRFGVRIHVNGRKKTRTLEFCQSAARIACDARRAAPSAFKVDTISVTLLTRFAQAAESLSRRRVSLARASGVARC